MKFLIFLMLNLIIFSGYSQGIDTCMEDAENLFGLTLPPKTEFNNWAVSDEDQVFNSNLVYRTNESAVLQIGDKKIEANGFPLSIIIKLDRNDKKVDSYIVTKKVGDTLFESCMFDPITFEQISCNSNLMNYLDENFKRYVLELVGLSSHSDHIDLSIAYLMNDARQPVGLKLEFLRPIEVANIIFPSGSIIDFGFANFLGAAKLTFKQKMIFLGAEFEGGEVNLELISPGFKINNFDFFLGKQIVTSIGVMQKGDIVNYDSFDGFKLYFHDVNSSLFRGDRIDKDTLHSVVLDLGLSKWHEKAETSLESYVKDILTRNEGLMVNPSRIVVQGRFLYKGIYFEPGDVISKEVNVKLVFSRPRDLWGIKNVREVILENGDQFKRDQIRNVFFDGYNRIDDYLLRNKVSFEKGRVVGGELVEDVRFKGMLLSKEFSLREDKISTAILPPQKIGSIYLSRPSILKLVHTNLDNKPGQHFYEIELNENLRFAGFTYYPGSKIYLDVADLTIKNEPNLIFNGVGYGENSVSLKKDEVAIVENGISSVQKIETLKPIKVSEALTIPTGVATRFTHPIDEISFQVDCRINCKFGDVEFIGFIDLTLDSGKVYEGRLGKDYENCKKGNWFIEKSESHARRCLPNPSSDSCNYWGTVKSYREKVNAIYSHFKEKK